MYIVKNQENAFASAFCHSLDGNVLVECPSSKVEQPCWIWGYPLGVRNQLSQRSFSGGTNSTHQAGTIIFEEIQQ